MVPKVLSVEYLRIVLYVSFQSTAHSFFSLAFGFFNLSMPLFLCLPLVCLVVAEEELESYFFFSFIKLLQFLSLHLARRVSELFMKLVLAEVVLESVHIA